MVGRQSGREIRAYQTQVKIFFGRSQIFLPPRHGQAGEELLLLRAGQRGVEEVFSSEQDTNRTATWIYRLAGWLGESQT